ncbi:hypothetical protein [Algibacter sp. PT7-4]|uniref:hypothetical protein n=1 Tax=Algibacter ulvanivorans TaxID=3400999 RepID=UPI003AAB8974
MIDKTLEIKSFIKKHYSPSNLKQAKKELQLSTSDVLNLLFQIFPTGCIDDYDLHEILTSLGYEPQKQGVANFVWCLKENL